MNAARRGRPTFGPLAQGPRNGPLFALVALGVLRRGRRGPGVAARLRHGALPLVRAAAADVRGDRRLSPCSAWSGAARPAPGSPARFALLLAAAGLAAALWQHFVAAQSASCNLTLADRIVNATGLNALLPGVFEARASCADAAVSLLGVSYDFWSAALFAAIGVLMIVALRRA